MKLKEPLGPKEVGRGVVVDALSDFGEERVTKVRFGQRVEPRCGDAKLR